MQISDLRMRYGVPWNRVRPQLRSYALVIGMFLSLLSVALATSWEAIELVNETRAYATGEGRYSKAEKMAVLALYRYADSRGRSDYDAFWRDVSVPLGDRAARLALTRSPPDLEAARVGLLQGHNNPSDINGIIRLFRWFSWWRPYAEAIEDWRIGDGEVANLIAEGRLLHDRMAKGELTPRDAAYSIRRIESLDAELTQREDTFSTHIGEAARAATALVVIGLAITTATLWAIGIAFATRLFRRQLALDRQLSDSERRFRDFTDVASDWYWEIDANNRVTYVSPRFYSQTKAPSGRIVGADARDLMRNRAENPDHLEECLRAIAERRPFRGLCLRFTLPDGTDNYCAISAKPNFDSCGTLLGYRGVGSDITAQTNDARELRNARDRAEIANRTKSQFLANMSHELRTPLNAIIGFSDVISQRLFGERAIDRYAEYARDIHNSGMHLLGIINDVLDLSKIEAGRTVLEECEAELDRLVEEACRLLGDRLRRPDFRIELPDRPLTLLVDDRKLIQILVNLLSNAFKFTPEGKSVTLAVHIRANGDVAIAVRDRGIGIAPEDLDTALSPFGQVESAFSRSHHGTGLGLPLAKSLTELHGGALVIESGEGKGTTVSIILPHSRVVSEARAIRA